MKQDTTQNRGIFGAIGGEAIYLRINQLQKGLLQFTDSANAERLVKEHGADIRYIAPWKKWVVWDDTHWQVDNGTVDLKTGELLPHCKEDMSTKLATVRYGKDAGCPMWKQFVREIMDYKADMAGFLQPACGWTMSGAPN
jgi:phage/plasmid-associated DNA primase